MIDPVIAFIIDFDCGIETELYCIVIGGKLSYKFMKGRKYGKGWVIRRKANSIPSITKGARIMLYMVLDMALLSIVTS